MKIKSSLGNEADDGTEVHLGSWQRIILIFEEY